MPGTLSLFHFVRGGELSPFVNQFVLKQIFAYHKRRPPRPLPLPVTACCPFQHMSHTPHTPHHVQCENVQFVLFQAVGVAGAPKCDPSKNSEGGVALAHQPTKSQHSRWGGYSGGCVAVSELWE